MMNLFWYDKSGNQTKGICWLTWDILSMQKCDRGVGLQSISAFNLKNLGKQG